MRRGFVTICFLAILIFLPTKANAQLLLLAKEQTGQLAIGPGFFSSDMGKDGVLQFYNPRISVGLNYIYRFHESWGMRIGISYGWYEEYDGNFRPHRGWNVSSHIMDVSILAKYFILKRQSLSKNCPDLYIGVGFGATGSIPTLWGTEGLKPLPTEAEYRKFDKFYIAPMFPVSIGASFTVANKFLMGFDYTIRISTNDYLDAINPIGSQFADMYSTLSLTLSYILKTDCYTCYSALSKAKFRKTKASSGYWF